MMFRQAKGHRHVPKVADTIQWAEVVAATTKTRTYQENAGFRALDIHMSHLEAVTRERVHA
ncbi:MAG: hypothetical protein QOE68_4598 [Thermoanaerobaculia bacterium]|nr:hypothetical protein [Thermoanaerobaculia bacterium]